MAKSKKVKSVAIKKVIKLKYGLHLGEMVRKCIAENPSLTQNELASLINIGRQGIYHRLENPSYGTCYDLIEISLLLKKDFITPMLDVINNNGIYPEIKYSADQYKALEEQVIHYKDLYERSARQIDVLHKLIDQNK